MCEISEAMLSELESVTSLYDSHSSFSESVSASCDGSCGCSDQCQLGCAGNCIEKCASVSRW